MLSKHHKSKNLRKLKIIDFSFTALLDIQKVIDIKQLIFTVSLLIHLVFVYNFYNLKHLADIRSFD